MSANGLHRIQRPRFVKIFFSFMLKRTRYRGRVLCFVMLTFASCLKERCNMPLMRLYRLMALRTTYISSVMRLFRLMAERYFLSRANWLPRVRLTLARKS